MLQVHYSTFSVSVLESVDSPWGPGSFYWRMNGIRSKDLGTGWSYRFFHYVSQFIHLLFLPLSRLHLTFLSLETEVFLVNRYKDIKRARPSSFTLSISIDNCPHLNPLPTRGRLLPSRVRESPGRHTSSQLVEGLAPRARACPSAVALFSPTGLRSVCSCPPSSLPALSPSPLHQSRLGNLAQCGPDTDTAWLLLFLKS